jgi:hypothetical protein
MASRGQCLNKDRVAAWLRYLIIKCMYTSIYITRQVEVLEISLYDVVCISMFLYLVVRHVEISNPLRRVTSFCACDSGQQYLLVA